MESNHPSGGLLRPAGFEVRAIGAGLAILQGFRAGWTRLVWVRSASSGHGSGHTLLRGP